jgi:hypothetical protein
MATQVQFRRGTTTQNNAFTGAIGEITYDTEVKTLRLHDGSNAGGGAVVVNTASAQTLTNKTLSTNSVWNGTAVALGYGGTGAALTAVAGAIAYSTGSALALTSAGTSGQVLTSGGSGAPTWVNAASITAGTATNATYATNINGGSAGQLVIQQDTGLTTFITAGASGTFLRSAGAGYAPTWATADVTVGSTVIPLGGSSTSLAGLDIVAATGTSHWTIPVGTTAQRPATPAVGMIRYNSSQTAFEGYAAGAWSSLGGVKSVDGYTYIIAETAPTVGNGDLDFYAENAGGNGATQVGQWNRTNLKDYTGTLIGTQTTQNVFNTTATTVNAFGAATTLTIGASNSGTATIRNTTVAITNNATIGGTLGVTGNTTLSGTLAVTGNSTLTGDLAVNGGDITTTSGTATLFNTNATTLNIGGAATTVSIGAATGTLTINNANTVITGNLTVNGTTTTINSTVTSIDDIEFELGSVASPTDVTANGGGIRLKGATDKTILWSSLGWTSSEDFNLVTGKSYEINGTVVLDASAVLGSATTATVAGAATTLTIGATSGTATIRNATVAVTNILTVGSTSTFTGKATFNGGADIVDSIAYDYNFTGTTSSTTATAMTSFASGTYRSGKLLMQVVNGTAYRILELLFVHDGTTVTLSENYAVANEIQTAATNTTFTASISAGTLTVFATASSGTSVIKGHATLFKV